MQFFKAHHQEIELIGECSFPSKFYVRHRRFGRYTVAAFLVFASGLLAVGCQPDARAVIEDAPTDFRSGESETSNAVANPTDSPDSDRDRLLKYARQPRQLLADAQTAAEGISAARLTFFRQERLGLLQRLQAMEEIAARYRAEPHSVFFRWITTDTPLSACVYVANQDDGKVLLLNRKGLFGGPGSVTALNPELAVIFKQAKLPITDFGPREVLGKLLKRISEADAHGDVFIQLTGAGRVGPRRSDCYQIKLHFPPADPFDAKLVDLFLHRDTLLVAGVRVWLTNQRYRDDETRLDALYWFVDYQTDVDWTDSDFEIRGPAG